MILETRLLQDSCKKILDAVDNNKDNAVTELLELEVVGRQLILNVTNNQYFVSVKIPLDFDTTLHAVINAKLFLRLISKITTRTVELSTTEKELKVKANGNYRIPLIYDREGNLAKLDKITISNVTNNFVIPSSTLQSILKYNQKELLKSGCNTEAQTLFYVDNQGAITFSNGACMNSFTLVQPVIMTLTEKIVKLFKLFKSDNVDFTLGYDPYLGDDTLTKAQFVDDTVTLTAILPSDSSLINKIPVKAIRKMAEDAYTYNIIVDKELLLSSIDRLSLFAKKDDVMTYIPVHFGKKGLQLFDKNKENSEDIPYVNECETMPNEGYDTVFNGSDLKLTLESCEDTYITLSFGNGKAVVLSRNNVKDIIPEVKRII